MNSRLWMALALIAALAAPAAGCGGDDDDDTGTDTDTDADTDADTDTDTDTDTDADGGTTGENGDFCDLNDGCLSGFCETWQSIPQDPAGVCADGPPTGEIRILANVRDFYSEAPMQNLTIEITGAMAALANPSGAAPLLTATTDTDGRFEVVGGADVTETPVGLVAISEADGYYLTISGLVEPELEGFVYPPGVRNHDVKVVPQAKLDEWSGYLASFSELASYLPLGPAAGAVLGKIRYIDDGAGVPGATINSEDGTTSALFYYLNEAEDGFNQTGTGSSGIFALFNPGLAEKFVALKDGAVVSRTTATMGQTPGCIYNNTIHVEGSAE